MDKVVHFEIPFDNSEKAVKFYQDIFGWKINKAGEMPYWLVNTVETDENMMPKTAGAINGAMLQRDVKNDPSGTRLVLVIEVSNVEEYCANIERAGGKVVLPAHKVGNMRIYARFEDTEGNVFGLWQSLIFVGQKND